MKKILILTAILGICSAASANTVPRPTELIGNKVLDGTQAYTWGIHIDLASGQQVTSASLSLSNVKLAVGNSSGTGYLYTDLLTSSTTGVNHVSDNDKAGDYFDTAGSGFNSSTKVDIGTKYFPYVGYTTSIIYTLTTQQLASLNAFLSGSADDTFAFGFDPDCHFSVGDINFSYTLSQTTPPSVPDGAATALLVIAGLASVELFRRKFATAQ